MPPFNHIPVGSLTDEQQQLLIQVEQTPISLNGNAGESIVVNLADLHAQFVSQVIIDEDNELLYPSNYWKDLRTRLKEYYNEILELIKALYRVLPEKKANEKAKTYNDLLKKIDDELDNIDRGILPNPYGKTLVLGRYNPIDKTVHLYLKNIISCSETKKVDPNYMLAYVYIHEMFHAFFHQMAGGGGEHYIREIEEPMAECGALQYLKNAHEQTPNILFSKIYKVAQQDVIAKQKGHLAAYGFGYYLHDGDYKPLTSLQVLGEYAQKSKFLDPLSFNVIQYCMELMHDYPSSSSMQHEGERILTDLLVHEILNVGQKQELSFEHLYEQTKVELKKSLLEHWQPKGANFDPNYQTQLEDIIDKTVSDNILVESMSRWQGATPIYKGGVDYTQFINSRMLKFLPYEHQVKCWYDLVEQTSSYKSMVVTTGTGSGKTESFMVPLITDLSQNNQPGLKAIFLYPLNALMEDQKRKLNELIEGAGGNLTFAVYNGSSPQWELGDRSNPNERFSHELVYREEIRGSHTWNSLTQRCEQTGGRVPDIILTNPTMLEYMLLRKADENIISQSQHMLSWVVIDETHTYNGAGADELAMLLRRVLKAFDIKKPNDIHFATSSATVGDSDADLLKFISGITGQDDTLISIIKGHRSTPDCSMAETPNRGDKRAMLAQLASKDYVYLDALIPYKNTVLERLKELDRLCQGGLKVKVHFYVEALTNGLYANMEDIMNGASQFQMETEIPFDTATCKLDSRYVRLMHCASCGKILANCKINAAGQYARTRSMNEGSLVAIYQYGVTPNAQNALPCNVAQNNRIIPIGGLGNNQALRSPDFSCPCCGAQASEIKPFNISSAECMRSITPVLLDNASAHPGNSHPYKGRQFISFADSRRGAAQPSLKQNLETEEFWVICTIMKNLTANASQQGYTLSWEGALDELFIDPMCEQLAACFAKKEDWDAQNGCLKQDYLKKYVLGALYNVMKKRSKKGFSAESYGIFKTHYTKLNSATTPQEVVALNNILSAHNLPIINDTQWQNLLKIYIDFHVRTNECLYFMGAQGTQWDELDIDSCRNLQTTYGLRRSIKDPNMTEGVHCKLLWRLFNCDNKNQLTAIDPNLPAIVDSVVGAMWNELQRLQLVTQGQRYYKKYGAKKAQWHQDALSPQDQSEHRTGMRLNVADIGFALNDTVYVDDHIKSILDVTFLGNSPYQEEYRNTRQVPRKLNQWSPPYPAASNADLEIYYNDPSRRVSYLLCKKTENIYENRDIFIQYEHTAQVHRDMTRQRTEKFKEHKINILACSTTMEMGVDIGELEIVAMSNVPPHPANYKQRAGRAGRAFQNKSTCVTICNSDAVGEAVLKEPKEVLLEREVITPSADLNSAQVVQRHVNSFLLREFFVQYVTGGHAMSQRNVKNYEIIDFFLDYNSYTLDSQKRNLMSNLTYIRPNAFDLNNFYKNSLYEEFRNWLLLLNPTTHSHVWQDLSLLVSGTDLKNVAVSTLIQRTDTAIGELFMHLSKELTQLQQLALNPALRWNTPTLKGYASRLNYDFVGLLKQNLLVYTSTHQFTPNANMPVNIVALKIRKDDDSSFDNPSRDLVVALSEYAPGKSVTIDGKSYTIGGVEWDRSQSFRTIHICKNCGYVWESSGNSDCPMCNAKYAQGDIRNHSMIEPIAFLPEEDTDRIIDNDAIPARVGAQLIGANGIHLQTLTHLADFHQEFPQANTKILYLLEGDSMGYCVCEDCGRAVIEKQLAQPNDTLYVRDLMYSKIERTTQNNTTIVSYEHKNLKNSDKQDDFAMASKHWRNMFVGGSISTNFSILKPYYKGATGVSRTPFKKHNQEDEAILITLGLVVCEELSRYIPCQRQDIDFLVTTFRGGERALCIYDTAKGGAGYSSRLDANTWKWILDKCHNRLKDIVNGVNSIDSIFTRSTMCYLEDVDVKATYDWLEEELQSRNVIPSIISSCYSQAICSSILAIKSGLKQANHAILFVQPDIKKWNYELPNAGTPSWKETREDFRLTGNAKTTLAFCGNPRPIPAEATDMIKHSEDWATFATMGSVPNGVYPLAYIDGWLYMTDDADTANFNGLWGSGEIFAVQTQAPTINPFTPLLSQCSEFYIDESTPLQSSKDLLDLLIRLDKSNMIKNFIESAQNHQLEFHYLDEHLKTQKGMVLTIQLINAIAQRANCDLSDFRVAFVNERFYDDRGWLVANQNRRIADAFESDVECKSMMDALLNASQWDYVMETKQHNTLPHWRSLTIKDLTNNTILTIKPHGGVDNGWFIDSSTAHQRGISLYADKVTVNTDIPLQSDRANKILYTVCFQ